MTKLDNLNRLLRPRHIAYLGGSQVEGAISASRVAGYQGEIWVVNPVRDEIAGLRCYTSVEDLPEAPDAALVALSPERTLKAVTSLQKIGAGGAACVAAGFAELGKNGKDLQQQLVQLAGEMAIVGPNCMGVLNLFDGAAIWASGGHLQAAGNQGAAIISQSGAFLYGITNVEQGFPLGYAISTGNQAVIDVADSIEAVLADERVRAIGIYLEGLNDGRALGRACWRALQREIPIIAMKGGDTRAAEKVAISHTSAMVVERDLWLAFCQRYGILEVSSPKAMVETLKMVTIGGVPKGNRLSAITYSGGLNSLIVAQAPGQGMQLLPPTAHNAKYLRSKLPEIVVVANPLDLNLPWTSKTGMSLQDGEGIADCLCRFCNGSADLAVMFLDVPRPDDQNSDKDWYPSMEAMAEVKTALGIPCAVASILPEGLIPELRQHLLKLGIAPLLGFRDVMEALAIAVRYGQLFSDKRDQQRPLELLNQGETEPMQGAAQMQNEFISKTALREFGLSTTQFRQASVGQSAIAAAEIGFPVALKLISDQISHKAKVGGVRLGLNSQQEVIKAEADIIKSASQATGIAIDQFLVEGMIDKPCHEYIIGIKRQTAMGLALMIGHGGVEAETINTHSTVLLPLVEVDLKIAMECVGLVQKSVGYEAMKNAIHAVAGYAQENLDTVESIDVNPVIINSAGEAIAGDALIVKRDPGRC